jgi:murein DD-endopeptidase MepM/ murein hydrolase activator NlpD
MGNRLGGNVVWLRDTANGRWLYYAHLDRHSVRPGSWVRAGDTLGFVGTTGNARTTPPHLHFGIYLSGAGAVDPYFHLYDPKREPPALADDAGLVPRWARIRGLAPTIRSRPSTDAPVQARPPALTPIEVIAATGPWFFVRLPDGREGYLDRAFTESLAPTLNAGIPARAVLRSTPDELGDEIDYLEPGRPLTVLGRFGAYVLVRNAGGLQGWIGSSALSAPLAAGGIAAAGGGR